MFEPGYSGYRSDGDDNGRVIWVTNPMEFTRARQVSVVTDPMKITMAGLAKLPKDRNI